MHTFFKTFTWVGLIFLNIVFSIFRLDNETVIEVNGTGNFRNEVVFAKMNLHQKLQELWQNIGLKLVENSIIKSTPGRNHLRFEFQLSQLKVGKFQKQISLVSFFPKTNDFF